MNTKILQPSCDNLEICAGVIRAGELVAFPTETVYGLGANAALETAVKKIFAAKGRPSDNPLIVHLGDKSAISDYAEVSSKAAAIIAALMPGPITILLKKRPCIPDIVTGGRDTVGIRIPASELAREFLNRCGVPVCAPSANTSSRPSPTTAQHVFDDLSGKIGYILDGGRCDIGIESTIIDLSNVTPTLLRKGKISASEIEKILGEKVTISDTSAESLCPGLKYKHYSPKATVLIVKQSPQTIETITQLCKEQTKSGKKTAILCYNQTAEKLQQIMATEKFHQIMAAEKFQQGTIIASAADETEFAQKFYANLRAMDKEGVEVIICETPTESEIGKALYNRMYKAAGGKIY